MKARYFIYIITIASLCFAACAKSADDTSVKKAEKISVSAVVDEVKSVNAGQRSRSEGAYTGVEPSANSPLKSAVWFSLESGKYPASLPDNEKTDENIETEIPVHSVINYQSGTATFPDGVTPKYPTSGNPVYCVGLYPFTGWTNADDSHATHVITGKEDLMFAPEISGNWNEHFATQRYRHMLTWLKVCVCTTTTDTGSYWGKLNKITLKDVPNSLAVDLSKVESNAFALQSAVTFSAEKTDRVILDNSEGVDLSIVAQEVASVFCDPRDNTNPDNKYVLIIECTKGKTKEIPITLSGFGDLNPELLKYPAGLQYLLVLYFHPYDVVDGICTLNTWNAQNEDLYPSGS